MHREPMARLGGVAIAVGFLLALLIFVPMDRLLAGFLAGAVTVFLTGILDDLYSIRPAYKFLGEIFAALVFIQISGVTLDSFGDLVGLGDLRTGAFAVLITVFCLVGLMNASNLIDGLDGLAAGLGAIAGLFLVLLTFTLENGQAFAISAMLVGSLLGFLFFNRQPASIFMGDSGSLLLGYALGAVAVLSVQEDSGSVAAQPVSLVIILGLPIFDTLKVMTQRVVRRKSPFQPDNTHLHHCLLDLGFSDRAVVRLLYALMFGFGLLAWAIRSWAQYQQFALLLILVFGLYLLITTLQQSGWQYRR